MSAWHTLLLDASYKGIELNVLSIDESNSKALVEHARPFVSGTDLEDMGNIGREVSISAIFFGKQYTKKLLNLLNALEEPGAGVLIHPVWGRMQNMIPASWHYRHEADSVDSAVIDITFKEASEAQPIFVFQNNFLIELENLISKLDTYRSYAEGFIDSILAIEGGLSDLWGSALGVYSGLSGSFTAIRELLKLNEVGIPFSPVYSQSNFKSQSGEASKALADIIHTGLFEQVNLGSEIKSSTGGLSARTRLDNMIELADQINSVPHDVFLGKTTQQVAGVSGLRKITSNQIQPISVLVQSLCLASTLEIATHIIEDEGESMNAPDLIHLNQQLRQRIQAMIDSTRATQSLAQQNNSKHTQAITTTSHACIEILRESAGRLNSLIIATINQKPPLVVKTAPLNGTIHQMAFAFYGDIQRANELIHLNPHLIQPSFIQQGDLINAYAK